MGTFIFFVTTIIFLIAYLTVKSDFKRYKQKQERFLKKLEESGVIKKVSKNKNFNEPQENIISEDNINQQTQMVDENIVKEKKSKSKKDNKINWLFGIGISLFCLTYFVLITSTWNILSDTLKCIFVLMFSILFFGASLILEKIIKAPKATIVFWCLGLMYIPFSLISLFGFGLLGEYLSFGGQGSNLCLTIIAFISLVLNLFSTLKFKNEIFSWLYIISEFLTILMGVRIFTVNYNFNLLVLSVYITLIVITLDFFKENNLVKLFEKQYNIYKEIFLNILNVVVFITAIISIITGDMNVPLLISIFVMTVLNMYISVSKKLEYYGVVGLYLFLEIVFGIISLICKTATLETYAIAYSICNILFILLRNALYNEEEDSMFSKIVRIFGYINIIILTMVVGFSYEPTKLCLIPAILTISSIILLTNKDIENTFLPYILPITVIVSIMNIVDVYIPSAEFEVYNTLVLIAMSVLFLITTFFDRNKLIEKFKQPFYYIIPVIVTVQFLLSLSNDDIIQKLIYVIPAIFMYILVYINSESSDYAKVSKVIISILSYILILIVALEVLEPLLAYTITATIFFVISIASKKMLFDFKDCFNIITIFAFFIGLAISIFESENYMIWYYIISVIAFMYYSREYKDTEGVSSFFKVCLLLTSNMITICAINYIAKLLEINDIEHIAILVNTLIISLVLLYKKQMTELDKTYLGIFNIVSAIKLLSISSSSLFIELLPSLSYIGLVLLQLPYMSQKMKDAYKVIMYIMILIPYNIIMKHFNITFVALSTLLYMILLYLITRTVLSKYTKDIKTIEVLGLILIYIISLVNGNVSFAQAIMLDILLAIVILGSFIKQEDAMFKCTSISFILMVFIQTKSVDFPVIWLVCLLGFGLFFVTFATIDEIKHKRIEK